MAKYYTPIATKAPANAETFNNPLQELDDQIDRNASAIAEQAEIIQELGADSAIQDQEIEALQGHMENAEADISDIDGRVTNLESVPNDRFYVTSNSAASAQVKSITAPAGLDITAIPDGTVFDIIFSKGNSYTGIADIELTSGETIVVKQTDVPLPNTTSSRFHIRLVYSVSSDVFFVNTVYMADKLRTAKRINGIPFDGGSEIYNYLKVSNAANNPAKTAGSSQPPVLASYTRAFAMVEFVSGNTAEDVTLSIASDTAQPVYGLPTDLPAGSMVCLVWNGTGWYTLYDRSAAEYTLPTASQSVLGGVKVGSGLSIDPDGVLSANSSGSGFPVPVYFAHITPASNIELTIDGVTEYTDGLTLLLELDSDYSNTTGVWKININNLGSITVDGPTGAVYRGTLVCVTYTTASGTPKFYRIRAGIANQANLLASSRYIDGLSFNGSLNVVHYISCTSAAADTAKIIGGTAPITNLSSNTNYAALWYRIRFTQGSTSRTMVFKQTANSSAADVVNSQGGMEMPDIPAGGYATFVVDPVLGKYRLVSVVESPTVISAASDTDAALDDLTRNADYDIDISGTLHRLTNIVRDGDIKEQILLSRPATITPGSTAAPVRKYRCREWDASNSVWLGWTEWTNI